jgi:hypothetical protein
LLIVVLVAQSILKLWLVHHREIGVCDYPNDDPWYVIASTHWYWGGSFAGDGFLRGPVYPLWIAVSRSAGFPLRLSTEYLLLAAAGTFVVALVRAGLPQAAAALLFGLVVFHPFSIYVNDAVVPDALYGPLSLFCVAGMIALLGRRGRPLIAVATAVALALLWQTRQEHQLVVVYVALFALVAAWAQTGAHAPAAIVRSVGRTVLIVAIVIAGVVLAVRTLNYVSFGSFADRELDMPGFVAAQDALLRITPRRYLRWVGVPTESLQRAYAVSPTLRVLQPYFDGPEGRQWAAISPQAGTSQREIPGRFGWSLRAAIHWAGQGNSAADTEAFCRRIAEEIETACATGLLPCTSPLGLVRRWLPQLPASLQTMARLLFWSGAAFDPRCATVPRPAIIDAFDIATNRRTALTTAVLHVAGWAVALDDPVQTISFQDADGRVVAFTDELRARPDLDAAFHARRGAHPGPLRAAFALRIPLPHDREASGALRFTLRSGRTVEVAALELRNITLDHPATAGRDTSLQYAIESRQTVAGSGAVADRFVSGLLQWYWAVVVALSVAGIASALILVAARPREAGHRLLFAVAVLLIGVTLSRVALLAVFDASMWPGEDPRFLYPVAYLYPCALVVLICCAVSPRSPRVERMR